MFKNRRLFENFISEVKEHRYTMRETRQQLKELPIKVLRKIGKEIIYIDYDGYNYSNKSCELAYFDNLNRNQKEFFIEQRLYKLHG